jgi:hypothetical protein
MGTGRARASSLKALAVPLEHPRPRPRLQLLDPGRVRPVRHAWSGTPGRVRPVRHAWSGTPGRVRPVRHECRQLINHPSEFHGCAVLGNYCQERINHRRRGRFLATISTIIANKCSSVISRGVLDRLTVGDSFFRTPTPPLSPRAGMQTNEEQKKHAGSTARAPRTGATEAGLSNAENLLRRRGGRNLSVGKGAGTSQMPWHRHRRPSLSEPRWTGTAALRDGPRGRTPLSDQAPEMEGSLSSPAGEDGRPKAASTMNPPDIRRLGRETQSGENSDPSGAGSF